MVKVFNPEVPTKSATKNNGKDNTPNAPTATRSIGGDPVQFDPTNKYTKLRNWSSNTENFPLVPLVVREENQVVIKIVIEAMLFDMFNEPIG